MNPLMPVIMMKLETPIWVMCTVLCGWKTLTRYEGKHYKYLIHRHVFVHGGDAVAIPFTFPFIFTGGSEKRIIASTIQNCKEKNQHEPCARVWESGKLQHCSNSFRRGRVQKQARFLFFS